MLWMLETGVRTRLLSSLSNHGNSGDHDIVGDQADKRLYNYLSITSVETVSKV